MKYKIIKHLFLAQILTAISCTQYNKNIESDYKVIEVDYGFNNYINNVKKDTEQIIIKERNIVIIDVNKDGLVSINNKIIAQNLIIPELKRYIIPHPKDSLMPLTIEKQFKHSGVLTINKNLMLSAKFNKDLNYGSYSTIRNKIFASFYEIRNEFSMKQFNKSYVELLYSTNTIDNLRYLEIKQIFPVRYSEFIDNN